MGNAASVAIANSVVPMSRRASAITQLWSSVWDDVPRSGDSQQLSLEVVRPLLSIAGSCVSVLSAHLGMNNADNSELPTKVGVSKALLAAAVNGDASGAALLDSVADPSQFIRALVKAAFKTSDGDYQWGLTESHLDELLQEHCCTQLEAAAALISDPSALLQDSLVALTEQIQRVIAKQPESDDYMGVAGRLLLKQRLDCMAKDARDLLQRSEENNIMAPAAQEAVASGAQDMQDAEDDEVDGFILIDTPTASAEHEDQEHSEGLEEAASIAAGDVEVQVDEPAGGEDVAADAHTRESTPGAGSQEDMHNAPPTRTKSQLAKSMKVEKVKGNLDTLRGPVYDLRCATSAFARQGATEEKHAEDEDLEKLKEEFAAISEAEKRARNYGEDLIEDMLTLDNLENLAPEDRSSRKAAYAGLEALLEDVDAAKSSLKPLRLSLEKRMQQIQEKSNEQQAQKKPEKEEQENKENISMQQAAAGEAAQQQKAAASMNSSIWEKLLPEVPSSKAWRQVRLPLQFHSKEELDHYMVVADLPNYDAAQLQAYLSEDMSSLIVKGLRAPSKEEVELLRQSLLSQLQALAKQSPGQLQMLRKQMGPETYFEVGEGNYGFFSESLRLPEDVNVEKISVGYEAGYLRIRLPKIARELRSGRPQAAPRGFASFGPASSRFATGMGARRPQRTWNDMYRNTPTMPHRCGGIDELYHW